MNEGNKADTAVRRDRECFILSYFIYLSNKINVEVPRLGVKLELQLLAYITATAMLDLSHICDLHHSLWQHRILNPLKEARDGTYVLMDTSWVRYC